VTSHKHRWQFDDRVTEESDSGMYFVMLTFVCDCGRTKSVKAK